jgi:hypothetical protein
VPTVTLTRATLEALGVSPDHIITDQLRTADTRLLEPVLASRGFDVASPIRVVVLTNGEGVVLTQ